MSSSSSRACVTRSTSTGSLQQARHDHPGLLILWSRAGLCGRTTRVSLHRCARATQRTHNKKVIVAEGLGSKRERGERREREGQRESCRCIRRQEHSGSESQGSCTDRPQERSGAEIVTCRPAQIAQRIEPERLTHLKEQDAIDECARPPQRQWKRHDYDDSNGSQEKPPRVLSPLGEPP